MPDTFDELKKNNDKIKELIDELITYNKFENRIKKDLKILKKKYLGGEFGYEIYQKLKEKLINTTKEDNLKGYSSYILSLADKIEFLNTKIFLTIYENKSLEDIKKRKKPALPIFKKIEDDIESNKIEIIATKRYKYSVYLKILIMIRLLLMSAAHRSYALSGS